MSGAGGATVPVNMDVRDTADDLALVAAAPVLRAALETLSSEVAAPFDRADRLALQQQRSYRRITWLATTFGTISLLLSVLGLVVDALDATRYAAAILVAQVVTLAITVLAVLRGLLAYRHENWLLERCRAEQIRALKFIHLVDPAAWSGDERSRQAWRERVRADVERASALRHADIAVIAGMELVPRLRMPERRPDPAILDALVNYYVRKRLEPQREYFLQASLGPAHGGARALPLFFFGAVFLEVLQAVFMVIAGANGTVSLAVVGTWLAAVAIAIPVLWAGIRTQQGAREASRNAIRSRARHGALTQLTERLLTARHDPVETLWTMQLAEFVLHLDQREWLRLLREAEWYG